MSHDLVRLYSFSYECDVITSANVTLVLLRAYRESLVYSEANGENDSYDGE